MQMAEILNTSVSVKNINTKHTNTSVRTITQVQLIADKLSKQLNNPSRFALYCRFAWHLPESTIWSNLESALAGRDPQRLFSWLCQKDMERV